MDLKQIERQRGVIYRRSRAQRIRTMDDAAKFINAVGFSLLFASTQNIELPSLFEAVKGRRDAHIEDWDSDSDRVWVWKNDLPAARRAYYGKVLAGGKPGFVSLKMLPHLLATVGTDDFDEAYARGRIGIDEKRVYEALRTSGPTPTMALRGLTGLPSSRYHHALDTLQRALVIVPVGAMNEHGAWPSQIFELTTRWFPRQAETARQLNIESARCALAKQYLQTVVAATPPMIARIFGWKRNDIDATIEHLVAHRIVSKQHQWIIYGHE